MCVVLGWWCVCVCRLCVCVRVCVMSTFALCLTYTPSLRHSVLTRMRAAQPEVRIAAGETLVTLTSGIKPEDLGPRVLTLVLQLAHDNEQEDLRMTAVVLLNELASKLGRDLCNQFVSPEIFALSEDPVFRVRKATALNMDRVLATAGGDGARIKLMPVFLRLSRDDIWGVRKACAEAVVTIAGAVPPEQRAADLVPVVERFMNDKSKWVRNAALQHVGPFIASLRSADVSPALMKRFIGMVPPVPASGARASAIDSGEHEMTIYCAFSFPAVVVTIGRDRWPELRELFVQLTHDQQRKVRRTLAYSLHEVARIIGPEQAEADLLPAFELFLRDLDEIKMGVVTHISEFLEALTLECRESYLPVMQEVGAGGRAGAQWRIGARLCVCVCVHLSVLVCWCVCVAHG